MLAAALCPCATHVGRSISHVVGWSALIAIVVATVVGGLRARGGTGTPGPSSDDAPAAPAAPGSPDGSGGSDVES